MEGENGRGGEKERENFQRKNEIYFRSK